ncbi:hypothetical protein JE959_001767 [Aeromonas veronii]|nr:hypothetical protein [Aeromonas veronii]
MAFRADESASNGFEKLVRHMTIRNATPEQRAACLAVLEGLVEELGPVVDAYPTWHPLVALQLKPYAVTTPSPDCGYIGLDHTTFFVNGFITCPYNDGQNVIDSVNALPHHQVAHISARRLGEPLYHEDTTAIVVKCEWHKDIEDNRTIPANIAVPLMLQKELKHWERAQVAETWDTMSPHFLGRPHGKRSSLFVTQDTGLAMKRVWDTLIRTGTFGPVF